MSVLRGPAFIPLLCRCVGIVVYMKARSCPLLRGTGFHPLLCRCAWMVVIAHGHRIPQKRKDVMEYHDVLLVDPQALDRAGIYLSVHTFSGSSTSISSQPVIMALKWAPTVSPVVAR